MKIMKDMKEKNFGYRLLIFRVSAIAGKICVYLCSSVAKQIFHHEGHEGTRRKTKKYKFIKHDLPIPISIKGSVY